VWKEAAFGTVLAGPFVPRPLPLSETS
jgi:hypothetical protein